LTFSLRRRERDEVRSSIIKPNLFSGMMEIQTTYTLIDGKKISSDIKNEIAARVSQRKQQGKKIPHLAIILIGDDGASQTYVDNKVKACKA
jgi:hypothetical protein